MNRDLRIGLSLSLLTLGVAGAFCFRIDPAAVDPTAADPVAVDPAAVDPAVAEAADEKAIEDDSSLAANPAPVPVEPPPEPVRLTPPAPVVAAAPVPLPVPAVGPPPGADPPPPSAALAEFGAKEEPEAHETSPSDRSGPRTYTVSPGDTLSGIAERELGSHRRYHTIFEANRDTLESPDALRVGMTLRIPDRL